MRRAALAILLSAVATAALGDDASGLRPTVRDVTPSDFTQGPKVDGPLVRIAPPVRPPDPARWWRFSLPQTTDAATFVTKGTTIRVSGVVPPAVGDVCHLAGGGDWPCGQVALTNLRLFLRGRDVECFYPPLTTTVNVVAPCRVGPTDVGAWLLTQGWAKPDDLATDDYRADAEEAQCAERGLWKGETPPAACTATN